MCFCENDLIEINIDILTPGGCLDINKFKWINFLEEKIEIKNFIDFKRDEFDLLSDFDTCRICELEIRKKSWQSEYCIPSKSLMNNINKLFSPTFFLQKTLWDDVGYELYKFYLIAAQKGINLM